MSKETYNEEDDGTEGASDKAPSNEKGVKLTEEFQREVYDMVEGATTTEELNYLEECARKKRYKMEEEERAKKNKGKEFDTVGMPTPA